MLTREEASQIITLLRRAPLQNMAEAEAAALLIARLATECPPESPQTDVPVPVPRKRKPKNNGQDAHP